MIKTHDNITKHFPVLYLEDTVLFIFLFKICFRETYRNFLARLETEFGVSQRGVQIVAGEMCELSNRVLTHCMKSVCEHLGKCDLYLQQL
jgi:hypothetical protein